MLAFTSEIRGDLGSPCGPGQPAAPTTTAVPTSTAAMRRDRAWPGRTLQVPSASGHRHPRTARSHPGVEHPFHSIWSIVLFLDTPFKVVATGAAGLSVEPERLRAKPQGLIDGVQLRRRQPRGAACPPGAA